MPRASLKPLIKPSVKLLIPFVTVLHASFRPLIRPSQMNLPSFLNSFRKLFELTDNGRNNFWNFNNNGSYHTLPPFRNNVKSFENCSPNISRQFFKKLNNRRNDFWNFGCYSNDHVSDPLPDFANGKAKGIADFFRKRAEPLANAVYDVPNLSGKRSHKSMAAFHLVTIICLMASMRCSKTFST